VAATSHTVKQGETITSIAFQFGFFPDTLWTLPENQALRELRVNGDVLMPGDVLTIPDRRAAAFDKPASQRHRFKRRGVPARLRLQFLSDKGPRTSARYVLTIDQHRMEGRTDGDGVLDVFVPPNAQSGEVTIEGETYQLQLGTLDPVDELTGVRKRLNNLGFFCGDPDAPLDTQLDIALRKFQERVGLPVTGTADDTTRARLQQLHDAPGALPATNAQSAS
jgi:hypothetical protein